MPTHVLTIAAELGISPEQVIADLGHARDDVFANQIHDETARSYIRDVRRGQQRHELLVAEYEAALAEWGEQKNAVYRKAFAEAEKENIRQLKREGMTGPQRKATARRMAFLPASEAADEWAANHAFPPFERWASRTQQGLSAVRRVEKILREFEAVPA